MITSATMQLISKTDSRTERFILALLTAYQGVSGDVQMDDVTSGTMAAPPNGN